MATTARWRLGRRGEDRDGTRHVLRHQQVQSVKTIGGMWITCEAIGEHAGMSEGHHSVFTVGYDPKKGKYVGSFISSGYTKVTWQQTDTELQRPELE